MSDPSAETTEGIRLARKATELGRDDAFALAAGGFGLAFLAGELDAGLALTDRALVLNPNLANGWHGSGWIRSYIGDPDTAIEHLAKAMRLSPLDFQMWQFLDGGCVGYALRGPVRGVGLMGCKGFAGASRLCHRAYILRGK